MVGAGSGREGLGFGMWPLVTLSRRLRGGMVWLWLVGDGDGYLMQLGIVVMIFVLGMEFFAYGKWKRLDA